MTDKTTARLREAMARVTADTSKVSMGRGKQYSTVASRVEAARYIYGEDLKIETQILVHPELAPGRVENSDVIVVKATISWANGPVLATGHAEEFRGSSKMTETSALEVCETSAIGRALASLGLHGGEYASINEIDVANRKAADGRVPKRAAGNRPDAQPDPFQNQRDDTAPQAVVTSRNIPFGHEPDNSEPEAEVGAAAGVGSGEAGDNDDGLVNPDDGGLRQADSGWTTALDAFRIFARDTQTIKELKEFWGRNKKTLDELKAASPKDFDLVRQIFVTREFELKGKKQ